MECFIVGEFDINLASKTFVLRGDEARHAIRVLRMRDGEKLMATTLHGFCYRAILNRSEQVAKNEWIAHCMIQEILPEHNEPKIDVQLIQGIPQQHSKLEEIVEKVTEIGVKSIVPIYSGRTEKKSVNRERLTRILQTACKQSSSARMPDLQGVMSLEEALGSAQNEGRKIILLHESAPLSDALSKVLGEETSNKITLVIGPEGGFDEAEVLLASTKYGARIASLGPRRLRAETAAIVAVALAIGM